MAEAAVICEFEDSSSSVELECEVEEECHDEHTGKVEPYRFEPYRDSLTAPSDTDSEHEPYK